MKLIVGLGNPGWRYAKTRHNMGFQVLDRVARRIETVKASWRLHEKFRSLSTTGEHHGEALVLAKPVTFMNRSGIAVKLLCQHHNLNSSDVIVVHDDKDIALGDIKVQRNRGHGGHNGIKSIIDELGTQDFHRVRVGVASDGRKGMEDTIRFVLGRFRWRERGRANRAVRDAVERTLSLL